ncbi:MAG: hypothetical protein II939_05855 [Bacteroidales bacterium]|nr:hypothetical protein [Bacteroidales bacterium]
MTATESGKETTLTGELKPAPKVGDKLILKYNETDYQGQDGTLATIASKFDYAAASVLVKDISESGEITISETSAIFENQQAIVKFTLKSEENNVKASKLIINGKYTIKTTTDELYVAIPAADAQNVSLVAITNNGIYHYEKSNTNFKDGNYYDVNVKSLEKGKEVNLATLTENTTINNGEVLTGTLGGNYKISIADGATVTLKDVTINRTNNNDDYQWAGISCPGNATIILEGNNTVKGFHENYPGIHIASDKNLTINGTGTLNASSNGKGAGIGGGHELNCGSITINGGTITAIGGKNAAGIGIGYSHYWNENTFITINGGNITAYGGNSGAGIGVGYGGKIAGITINGGTIEAYGGEDGAGIGSGVSDGGGRCGNILISGGNITAQGSSGSSGIGCGANCDDIVIEGGTVTAIGGDNSTGIGNGSGYYGQYCENITITAGVEKVTAIKGKDCINSIGKGRSDYGSCGTVTIEDPSKVEEK